MCAVRKSGEGVVSGSFLFEEEKCWGGKGYLFLERSI